VALGVAWRLEHADAADDLVAAPAPFSPCP
jgi:hypothetical protein